MIDLKDIFDAAIIGGVKAVFLGPAGPYMIALVGVAVGTSLLEKWLVKRRHEMAAKGIKTTAFVAGGLIAISALLQCCRHAFAILR